MNLFTQVSFVQDLYVHPLVHAYGLSLSPLNDFLNFLSQILRISTLPRYSYYWSSFLLQC